MRLARCHRKEAGGDERMHRARQHALLLAVALRRFLDRAQVALHVKRVDAVLPLLARRLFVPVRQHRLRERSRDLQIPRLRREPRRQMPDDGGMSPWRSGSTWMACSRVKSASSGRKPKVSARATSPGMGGISMTASVATGAWVRADVRSTAAAKTATANARRMALPRTARGTGSIVQAPNRRPKKRSGGGPLPAPPAFFT